jgi:uncharacterized protein involved in exopolysaccharide biosynthesis/Mrp family chromosome partitioning ATPase
MNSLPFLLSVLRRRAIPASLTFLSAVLAGVVYALSIEPVYQTSARIVIDDEAVSVSELGQAISEVQGSFPSGSNILATQSELIKSERVLQRAMDQMPLELKVGEAPLTVSEMKESLNVKILPATNILELSYVHPEPEMAAAILNEITEAVIEVGSESIRAEATAIRNFLENELPQQEEKLKAAEEAESQYRLATGIIALDVQTENLVESLTAVREQERSLRAQLREVQAKDSRLREVTGVNTLDSAYTAVRLGQDEEINQLEAELLELESAVVEMQSRLGPQHPDLLALLEQREAISNLYRQELSEAIPGSSSEAIRQNASDAISQDLISQYILQNIELSAIEEALSSIEADRAQLENNLSQIPRYQQPLASLIRQREEAASALTLLRNKLEEARIAEGQIVNNIRLVDTAAVPGSYDNSLLANFIIASAAGLFLAICVVLLLEAIDDRLHDLEELEALVDLPVLGMLPKNLPNTTEPDGIRDFLSESQWTEPYRLIFKTLEFQNQNEASRKSNLFVISGLEEYEGQSLFSAHLAAVASQMCRQTLLIDANWYQPLQHLFFGVRSFPGLVQALDQPKSDLKETSPSMLSGLDVLAYGGANEKVFGKDLSETPEMRELLQVASERHDCVAISTSALSTCADAITLSSYGAGLVLVVQANVTSKSLLKQTLANLERAGGSVLGIVMVQTPDPIRKNQPTLGINEYNSASASLRPKVQVDAET